MSFLIKTLNPDFIKNHTKTVILIWILLILGPISGIMLWSSFLWAPLP